MTRWPGGFAVLFALSLLLGLLPTSESRVGVAEAESCEFRLGFAAMKIAMPDTVGECVEDERHNPGNGDGLQQTTHGLLVWRKADNFTAFTDGFRTWISGPVGVAERLNAERFDWEFDATDLVRLTEQERSLADAIDRYRASRGLTPIRRSFSLTRVAKTHVGDLQRHPPQLPCSMHSWSADGDWTPVCYTPDNAQAAMMWSKPREISRYPGDGYEIALSWSGIEKLPAERLLDVWRASPDHDAIISQSGRWANHPFSAMGVGVLGSHAVVWFGEVRDPVGEPEVMR
jgi:hypothetical protein